VNSSDTQLFNDSNTVKSDYALVLQELSKFCGNIWKHHYREITVTVLLVILRSEATAQEEKKSDQQTCSDVTEIRLAWTLVSIFI